MAESDVFDEEKLFETFLQRGKDFGLQETDLDYVDKLDKLRKDRIDLLCVERKRQTENS